jgi:hypothetical protein
MIISAPQPAQPHALSRHSPLVPHRLVSRNRFLVVFGVARCLRYSFVAWLGAAYGRQMVRVWSGTLQKWSTPLLSVFVSLLVMRISSPDQPSIDPAYCGDAGRVD